MRIVFAVNALLTLCRLTQMIFPCVATHYHPLVYQRAQRLVGVDPNVPLDKRKKIVYLTRRVRISCIMCAVCACCVRVHVQAKSACVRVNADTSALIAGEIASCDERGCGAGGNPQVAQG
jgi:hypothetical protein